MRLHGVASYLAHMTFPHLLQPIKAGTHFCNLEGCKVGYIPRWYTCQKCKAKQILYME